MRQLFIALAKLLGICQIFFGLGRIAYTAAILGNTLALEEKVPQISKLIYLGEIALFALVYFGIAWMLIFRTEWLADKLGISADAAMPSIAEPILLRAGVKLLGVSFIILAIPETFEAVAAWVASFAAAGEARNVPRLLLRGEAGHLWSGVAPAALKLGLAAIAALKTDWVLRWVAPRVGSSAEHS